jgi:hypothetical protein
MHLAAGDPASSGRAKNVTDARADLNVAKNVNSTSDTAAGNVLQSSSDKLRATGADGRSTNQGGGSLMMTKYQVTQDNTRVMLPIHKSIH